MERKITGNVTANEIRVTIIDAEREVHDALPTGMADIILAALTAEPETLEDLEIAIARYDESIGRTGWLKGMKPGASETPWDAGLMIIDLPGRLIIAGTEAELYAPAWDGGVRYCPDPPPDWSQVADEEVCWIPYCLSDDWILVIDPLDIWLDEWRELAEKRREDRGYQPPFDAHPGMFDPVAEFIAQECLAARDAGKENPVVEIHERWMLSVREELDCFTPRAVLLRDRRFIENDLDSRAAQWTLTGKCPPGLAPDSPGYRHSGFGVSSNVVYFDLLRYLVTQCWAHVRNDPSVTLADETTRLKALQANWLEEGGDYGRRPGWILEQERRRIPIPIQSEEELVFGHDSYANPMPADPEMGLGFWQLDGHKMNEEKSWVFSTFSTRERWEENQRYWEEFDRRYSEEQAREQAEIAWAGGAKIFDDRRAVSKQEYE